MASAHHDAIKALKSSFYQDPAGNVYEIENFVQMDNRTMIEGYKLKKEGGLERVQLSFGKLSELENVGERTDFADSKGKIKYKNVLKKLAQSEKNKTGPECSVHNPGYSNMLGRPTGHRHDSGFDNYKGFSNYYGPSGHRH